MMHHLRIPILWLALLAWLPNRLLAQTLDPAFHIPAIYGEATVKDAVQMPNGQFVVAGDFTRINGQAGSGLARFDAAGVEDQVFRQNLSAATVWAGKLLPMPNGQLLVQGRYQNGATQRNYLFRLNANGTLDPTLNVTFSGSYPAPEVREMLLQADGRIIIRGDFTTNANAEIVRLQSDGTLDPSFSVSLTYGSQVNQMLLQTDGKIILGGPFTWLNGSRAFFVARLNTNGSTDTSFQNQAYTNAPLYVNSIALTANGSVVVGGYAINVVGGQSVSIFRLLPTGALDPGFAVPASVAGRDCQRLVVTPNGQVAVLQSTYSTLSQTGARFDAQLVRLQANGALDAAFQPGSGPDWALSELRGLPNGNLLTWGYTSNFSGQRRTLSLLQPTGALETTFAPLLQVPGNVRKVVRQADGKLLIAGYFNSIDGHLTDRIARLLPDGQPDLNFAWRQPNSASWTLSALAVQADDKVLVAGNTLNGNTYTANSSPEEPVFARLTTSGLADPGFVPAIPLTASSPRSRIQLLAEQAGGQIIVGGAFTDAAGKANLTRLLANGSVEPTFAPPAAQPVVYSGLVQANGSIVCVVPVTGATYSQTLQRLLPGGNPDPAFAYTPPAQASQGLPYTGLDRVYQVSATGDYITSGVLGATRVLARATASGADVAGFTTPFQPIAGPALAYSGVNAVAAQADGRLVVGGYMQQSSQFGAPATLLARLEANGQLDATFSTSLITNPTGTPVFERYSVSDVLVQPDGAVVAGGYFLQAAGQPATGLVRFLPTGVLAVRTAKADSRIQAWPVPAREVLHLQLEASAHPQRVQLLDALGKTVISQEATAADVSLNTAALAPGVYVLRVDYASGPATRRIVVE